VNNSLDHTKCIMSFNRPQLSSKLLQKALTDEDDEMEEEL
jgi:hypothetical protein